MIIVGLDVSLTCTGAAVLEAEPGEADAELLHVRSWTTAAAGRALAARGRRLQSIRAQAITLFDELDERADRYRLLVVEGPDLHNPSGELADRCGLWWDLLHAAHAYRFAAVEVPPSRLKLFTTGHGRSSKQAVKAAVERRYGVSVANDDEADALGLAAMGAEAFGAPLNGATVPVGPQYQTVLDTVWPTFTV